MKTIKIFLASSEELKEERLVFADLVLQLNQLFKSRSIELELVKWEYLDASMGEQHKQEEYNEKLRDCEMCMVMYWRRFGRYTEMELDTAFGQMKSGENPQKVYVFFKRENAEENISAELKSFKDVFVEKYGHFPCTFENPDTMRLEFLLQLENYQNAHLSNILEVSDEKVKINNKEVIDLNKIPFACQNEDYLKMQSELTQLRTDIEKKRFEMDEKKKALEAIKTTLDKIPEEMHSMILQAPTQAVDEAVHSLQLLLNRRNDLQKEHEEHQKNLFNTARRITDLRTRQISDRMQRAIEAFERGDVRRANIILEEAEQDALNNLKEYKRKRADTEQARQLLLQNIEELTLKASTLMADASIPIDTRIAQTDSIYTQAVEMAKEAKMDEEKYHDVMWVYARFLADNAKFDIALIYFEQCLDIVKKLSGEESGDVAATLLNMGNLYGELGMFEEALSCLSNSLVILKHSIGEKDSDVADVYESIGNIHVELREYDKALELFEKSLNIRLDVLTREHTDVAGSYHNIGMVHSQLGNHENALLYYEKSLHINLKVLNEEHRDVINTYNNIGIIYDELGNYTKALEYFNKSLHLYHEVLGEEHPDVAMSYENIGGVCLNIGDFNKAMMYLNKSLEICLKVYGDKHYRVANVYNHLGYLCLNNGDFDKALIYYSKGLDINLTVFGHSHPIVAEDYFNLGLVYYNLCDIDKSLEMNLRAADLNYIDSYNNIACAYHLLGKYDDAFQWAYRAIESDSANPASVDTLASLFQSIGRYNEAMEQFELCLKLKKEQSASEESIKETEEKIKELRNLMNK